MDQDELSIELKLPPGEAWAVGVSGGADSVALLLLLHDRGDRRLHVVHLDHELRGADSDGDGEFVKQLAARLDLRCTIARRSVVETKLENLPANPSARYRADRLALFREVVDREELCGVMLAHHADDVAETTLHRLLRGSGPAGLGGMAADAAVAGVRIVRPLLAVRRAKLREFLTSRGQTWREDASNQSEGYLRNRLRAILMGREGLSAALRELAGACRALNEWTIQTAPKLAPEFRAAELAALPPLLARQSARRWLMDRGREPQELTSVVLERLILMCTDAATPPARQFPGNLTVHRRGGRVLGTID